jgi:hypothetical protein
MPTPGTSRSGKRRRQRKPAVSREQRGGTPGGDGAAQDPPHDRIDDASNDSFPASDPPSWTGSQAGCPGERADEP